MLVAWDRVIGPEMVRTGRIIDTFRRKNLQKFLTY